MGAEKTTKKVAPVKKQSISAALLAASTSKLLVTIMTAVWLITVFMFIYFAGFTKPEPENIAMMQWIFQGVTVVMVQGVIGYLIKSTIENKSKYGNTPYGVDPNITTVDVTADPASSYSANG